jgi:hypothetical protein
MADMVYDEDGFLEEPCLSCDYSYVEEIFHEWCCDANVCLYKIHKEFEAFTKALDRFYNALPRYLRNEMLHPKKKPRGSIRRIRQGR